MKSRPTLPFVLSNRSPQVYFDMEVGGEPAGRIVMGLYGATVPKVRASP